MPGYGEKPGKGTYMCTHDGQRIVLESDKDMLMECPSCEGMEYVRVEGQSADDAAENPTRLVAVLGYRQTSEGTEGGNPKLDAQKH